MGEVTPTANDYLTLDFNGDGRISSQDYLTARDIVSAGGSRIITGTVEINTTDVWHTFVIKNSSGEIKSWMGLNGMHTPNFGCDRLTSSNSILGTASCSSLSFQGTNPNTGSGTLSMSIDNAASLIYTVVSTF